MSNFTLKFGKYKGQQFNETPKSYQQWLISQEWFKMPSNEAKYDIVRKFVTEYAMGMGKRYERVLFNLTWQDAETLKEQYNLYHLDDCTAYFFIEPTR
jgi:hypothetical protein